MKPANFAPTYACLYPSLAEICREHGYALAVHGSMARDFDLVCIPWVEQPSTPDEVVKAILAEFAFKEVGNREVKEHGRFCVTIAVKFGECFIDLSFMPIAAAPKRQQAAMDDAVLPCDVILSPTLTFRKGCHISGLLSALEFRRQLDDNPHTDGGQNDDERIQEKIGFWSMRPQPGTPAGMAWESGCKQGWRWGLEQARASLGHELTGVGE